jgi:predicted transcriptional regulator
MPKDVVLSARVSEETKDSLADLAAATDRPIAWHVNQALANYVELNRWQVESIKKGLAEMDAGEVVPLDDVARWVKSWGTRNELPRPEPRKRAKRRK